MGRWEGGEHTGLHAHEGVPGVEGAAVAEAGGEARGDDGDVGVVQVDIALELCEP